MRSIRFLKSISVWDEDARVCFLFFFNRFHTEIFLFKPKAFKQSTLSLGGCHRSLWQHQETGPALFKCMTCNARILPRRRFYSYKKLCKANFCLWTAVDQLSEYKVAPVIPRYTSDLLQGARNWVFPDRAPLIHQIIFKLNFSSEASFLTPITLY